MNNDKLTFQKALAVWLETENAAEDAKERIMIMNDYYD